jgi:DNA-directed RNA polymerase, mitochondrial
VGGDIEDIHQTVHACLQVGRLERAESLMRRLQKIYRPDAAELLQSHNDYISILVDEIVYTKKRGLLEHVQRWFEVDLRGSGVVPNALTYALMIRASFYESKQTKIDRTIRRYLALAARAGLQDETMAAALHILNDQQIGKMCQVSYRGKKKKDSPKAPLLIVADRPVRNSRRRQRVGQWRAHLRA